MTHDIAFFEDEHKYLVDGEEVPSVTTILNYMSDVEYGGINKAVLDQASRRGSLVHEYTELIDCDADPDEVEYEVLGYLKAYKQFLHDYKPDWWHIEKILYNESVGYIGTADRIGTIDGEISIVDIKTLASPSKMAKFTVSSQTIAYRRAYIDMLLADKKLPTQTIHRYALYLGKDGDYNLVDLCEYDMKYGYNSWGMFLACWELYKKIQKLKASKPIKKGKDNGKTT